MHIVHLIKVVAALAAVRSTDGADDVCNYNCEYAQEDNCKGHIKNRSK